MQMKASRTKANQNAGEIREIDEMRSALPGEIHANFIVVLALNQTLVSREKGLYIALVTCFLDDII